MKTDVPFHGMKNMAVRPKDATTVILLREATELDKGNFEILMVLRNQKSKFVPGSHVFPGGCLDREDSLPEMEHFCTGIDQKKARVMLPDMSSPDRALGVWIAGIRETFEEVGLLMAYHVDNTLVSFSSDHLLERFRSYRQRLQKGEISLKTILLNEELKLATDRLHYFSHWITPELLPLRYDVRFFIAEAPPNQVAMHDGIELTSHMWITPKQALDAFNRNRLDMVVPTLVTVEELAGYTSIAHAIEATRRKEIRAILTVMIEEAEGIVEYMSNGRTFKHMPPSVL
jgi:8-oxo-dGTP pyrophosphatase MutT (NUDIX family)